MQLVYMVSLIGAIICLFVGDMEFKQNKFLSSEKQIVTASPDVNTVSGLYAGSLSPETFYNILVFLLRWNSAMMMISLFLPAMEFGKINLIKF